MVQYTARQQKYDEGKHQEDILLALEKSPKTFKELENAVLFSHTTLSKHLKLLRKNGLITKTIHNENEAYKLTEKGESAYNEIFLLQNILTEIKERGGKYLSGGVPMAPVPKSGKPEPLFWPSTVHVAVDQSIDLFQLISKEYLIRIQNELIRHILENIQNKKLDLRDDKTGSIILGISLNYDEIVKMVKNDSYEKWGKLWKKEKAIDAIWIQDSVTPHTRPYILKYHIGDKKK
ncbi:winged helix-turn-helix transcriptional regulator [Candidatus Nitrosotalea okcheonensis]|uniref:HTH arsR-type domain-containing protein n=1 Tax=Candidatus Nitrosotalea okcheonensis TaxID=1903276 RepID=A0A2H1FF05_9ARCH|nr:ArsR family transcriptional regulator [Candidatus Nitrosotalea okcheonensis]SMH71345.1 protein of unknown function [Candidatus Nitrosotalea okcheonensis]